VNPVTTEGATSRFLYLPPAAGWYDFWSGEKLGGRQAHSCAGPLDRISALHSRGEPILPMGPEIEYAGEKPDAPIELRIYRGAMEVSTSTRTRATATHTKRARTPLPRFTGRWNRHADNRGAPGNVSGHACSSELPHNSWLKGTTAPGARMAAFCG